MTSASMPTLCRIASIPSTAAAVVETPPSLASRQTCSANWEEWVTFATPTALERDHEELGYAAFVDTEWHGVLPLHADSAEDLEGLGVRVVRTTAEGDQVILIGEIPDLVR